MVDLHLPGPSGATLRVWPGGTRSLRLSWPTGQLPSGTWRLVAAGLDLTGTVDGDEVSWALTVDQVRAVLGQRWAVWCSTATDHPVLAGAVLEQRPLPGAGDGVSVEVAVVDGDPVVVEVGGPGGGTSVHGELTGRAAPDQHPAAAVSVDPADTPVLDPSTFEGTALERTLASGAPPEVAAEIAAALAAIVVPHLVTPDTVLAAIQSASELAATGTGLAFGADTEITSHGQETTTAHGGIVAATDPRLTNARTPTAHAASHGSGGSDPVSPAAIGAAAVAHDHDGAAITSGTITPARLGTGSPAADRVLTGDGAWSPLPTAMGAWTPLPDTVYPSPADLGGHDGLTALPTETPAIGETWWSWRDAQGPWAIAQIGLSISALGATPSAFRLHVHSRSTSGRPGTRLWVAPATITPTATGILWLTLAAPLVVPAWTVFGVGVQCVSGGTTVLHVTPRRQEPTAPTAAVATNNTYRWLSTGTTTPLGDSPPVSIGTPAPAKVLIRTAA